MIKTSESRYVLPTEQGLKVSLRLLVRRAAVILAIAATVAVLTVLVAWISQNHYGSFALFVLGSIVTAVSVEGFLSTKRLTIRQARTQFEAALQRFVQHPRWRSLIPSLFASREKSESSGLAWSRAGAVIGSGLAMVALVGVLFNWGAELVLAITAGLVALREAFASKEKSSKLRK